MPKFYRVKQDTFLWEKGAILKHEKELGTTGGYLPIEDIWNVGNHPKDEFISEEIIECKENAHFFERVYPDSVSGKIYRTKDQLAAAYAKAFK